MFIILLSPPPAAPELGKLLKGIENHYNRVATLQVRFEQSYSAPSRGRRTESGELYLRKPGRMRWDYTQPAGKLFVSDGKDIYFYSPGTNRAEKMKLKESEDMRAPLAFLLGRLDFNRDFREFRTRQEGGVLWITALPKSDRLPYREVEFQVSPAFEIKRLRVTAQDNSVLEFAFDGEKMNPPLAEALFKFKAPPGAEVVEELGRGPQER